MKPRETDPPVRHSAVAWSLEIRRLPEMTEWTADELLRFDIAFALKKVTIPGYRKAMTEEQRMAVAETILEHLKLCRWEFNKPSAGRA
jgi:hypothetical protein